MELHLLAARQRRTDGEVGDEGRELGVVGLDGRCAFPALTVIGLEQLLRLLVHEDDVGAIIGHEDRVGHVLENEIQPVAFALGVDLRKPYALYLALELVRCAPQVGDVSQHGYCRPAMNAMTGSKRMRQNLEQKVVAFIRIDEIELA